MSPLLRKIRLLQNAEVLSALEPDELAALAQTSHWRRHPEGSVVARAGDFYSVVFVVETGQLLSEVSSAHGDAMALFVAGPGDVVGHDAFLAPSGSRTTTLRAMTECVVLAIDARDLATKVRARPVLAMAFLEKVALQLRERTETLADLRFLTVEARLAKRLIELSRRHGRPLRAGVRIELRLTQRDLAKLVGATRESINKVVARWRRKGIVHEWGCTITIWRMGALIECTQQTRGRSGPSTSSRCEATPSRDRRFADQAVHPPEMPAE